MRSMMKNLTLLALFAATAHALTTGADLVEFEAVLKDDALAGCKVPGACGTAYQGCCFGAKTSGDACTCKLTDGTGNVGSTCSGTDKAGACGVAYTACCLAYKVRPALSHTLPHRQRE